MAYSEPVGETLRQGDILAGVRAFYLDSVAEGTARGELRTFSFSVIVTQDCDLEQDYAARYPVEQPSATPDKLLFGILLCGVYHDALVRAGRHRPAAQQFARKEWGFLEANRDPRFQHLGPVCAVGRPLVADFKDSFMVQSNYLYDEIRLGTVRRVTAMDSPYKEHLLQRFASYMMRV